MSNALFALTLGGYRTQTHTLERVFCNEQTGSTPLVNVRSNLRKNIVSTIGAGGREEK